MAGTHVTIAVADGGAFVSYVAAPAAGKKAGVVLVSTISGVDSDMTYYADTLAAEGFVASAPDMFWRDADPGPLPWTAEGRKRAFARNERHDLEQGMRDLFDVIADLKKHPRCNGKIAVMGFCFGSPFALLAAARYGTDAGISFHGSHVEDLTPSRTREYTCIRAGHGFMTMTRGPGGYMESVAHTAWARALEVLKRLQA